MITAVIPTHNRYSVNLANLLCSLHQQVEVELDIIVVDTSDDIITRVCNRALCRDFQTDYMALPRRSFWKARSLNIGLAAVDSRYAACIDVDMYLHPEFMKTAIAHFRHQEAFVLALCGYLPAGSALGDWEVMRQMAYQEEVSRRRSPGGVQIARTTWFKRVGGYDEKFSASDGVDVDMLVRARKDGLVEVWLEDPLLVMHQWHPPSPLKGVDSDKFNADPAVVIARDWLAW